ncbi:MAG TPA: HAD family hydrolase [Candidatus Saccharimonadales bacterium]
MANSQIKTVVFDLDGTLLDGFGTILEAYQLAAEKHDFPLPTEKDLRYQMSQAPPMHDIVRTFFPGADVAAVMDDMGKYVAANATGYAKYEGLLEVLATLKAKNLTMAILTGGDHHVHELMRHHDIEHYFTSIVHCDRVNRSKPDPEGFLLAMDECGTVPSEAIMIGDSPTDIFAGKNAGVRYTIGITHGHGSRADLEAADPDYVVGSLGELSTLLDGLVRRQ